MCSIRHFCLILPAVAVFSGPLRAFAEELEVTVGRSATGQIKVQLDFEQPIALPPSVFPGYPGYATGEMGFHSTLLDEPANDFFQLSSAADFRFILLAKDPGIEVWKEDGSVVLGIGDAFLVGPPPFDTHPLWNIVSGTPGNAYGLTLKLIDLNGIYSESAPFELSFTPALVPGTGPFELRIARIDPQHATLSWTTNAIGWQLESAVSPGSSNWNAITNFAVVADTNFSLTIPTDLPQQFFRLRKQ